MARAYRTPRIIDQRISLDDYTGEVRQIAITDLGHEEPTLLLTNQLRRGAPSLIENYAKRMLIENSISDGVDFFHMARTAETASTPPPFAPRTTRRRWTTWELPGHAHPSIRTVAFRVARRPESAWHKLIEDSRAPYAPPR